ncbi:segregation and condensation protein B [Pilibacter termitis]|uniref:Segregation and condensation protein B n=1 Tax=Pilibacter termitis TaxID=263852 RepID=A0A1T4QMD9_9ENTE|nr:SMC-Scp complex subunit ScpB [Pilibacter termitis]SKA04940.1 segregation and condensation protein B [Pilibacter termitis]
MNIKLKIEALLFVTGDEGVELKEMARLLSVSEKTVLKEIKLLEQSYRENKETSLQILEVGERFMLTTKEEFADFLKEYAASPIANTLSQAALEVLSIIAYKQPISRMQVDELRGVGSSGSIQKLVHFRLIEEVGRMETPGRPILYGTTDVFMDMFGLRTMEDLPDIAQMEQEMNTALPVDLFFDRYADKEILFDDEVGEEKEEKNEEDR